MFLRRFLNRNGIGINSFIKIKTSKHFSSTKSTEEGEDYLKVHQENLFWFPKENEKDSREIGPYPPSQKASNDPSQSYQFRPADLDEYFSRQGRRRFGEVLPEEAEFQGTWNVDIEGNYSVLYMLSGVGLLLGGLGGIAFFSTKWHDQTKSPRAMAVEKELPYTDKYFPNQQEPRPIFTWSQQHQQQQQQKP